MTALTPNSGPLRRALCGVDALVVARGDAPVVGAPLRPFPLLGAADRVVVADFLDFRGVLDDAAVRPDEVAEDVVARTVAPRTPDRREAGVAQAADTAHHAVDVGHLEGDVVQRGDFGARIGDAMVRAGAAHEVHEARAVG